jgi:hypothetical protein
MKDLSNGIFVVRIAGLRLVQSLHILPISQRIQICLSVQKPTYPTHWSRLLNSSLYLLALFEQLFEASQIDNLAQNS